MPWDFHIIKGIPNSRRHINYMRHSPGSALSFQILRVGVSQSKEDTMLLINNREVEKLFTMKDCLEALEDGYDD